MKKYSTVTRKGQVTIPMVIRENLGNPPFIFPQEFVALLNKHDIQYLIKSFSWDFRLTG
jgi:bifunctional DNA-binding transcriptional regulator/antitoxin component of YhaV-PrlF toxin-antitoxin module